MSRYDFSKLSALDFEELVHDLLEAKWRVSLEAFKAGRDRGIDLRYISSSGNLVIQCKHYINSSLSNLCSKLKLEEKVKIDALAPSRYVLATSLGLTPSNKDQICDAVRPHIRSPKDILGASELEALLRRFPEIEKVHFKLWLTSTPVLERVLFNAERSLTEFRIEQIEKKIPLYVQNGAVPRAMDILSNNKYVIISGPPGIGKTTLAEMLIYEHLQKEYELIVIQSDLVEGRRFYRSDRRQIYYFDDFLGQTYLGDRPEFFLGQNRDKALVDFVKMIQGSKHSRFIMTTREHILINAVKISERLRACGISDRKCLIQLEDYRKTQKARILYNHIYFSSIPVSFQRAFVSDKIYLRVVNHPNFTPRVVEWLSTFDRLPEMNAEDYGPYVLNLIEHPEEIWTHAFEREISHAARNLLITLYSCSFYARLDIVEANFRAFNRFVSEKYHTPISANDFRVALKELEGTFFEIRQGELHFINPSVRDFLGGVLIRDPERCVDVIEAAEKMSQVSAVWSIAIKDMDAFELIKENYEILHCKLESQMSREYVKTSRTPLGVISVFTDFDRIQKLSFLLKVYSSIPMEDFIQVISICLENLVNNRLVQFTNVAPAIGLIASINECDALPPRIRLRMINEITDAVTEISDSLQSEGWANLLEDLDSEYWSEEQVNTIEQNFETYREDQLADEIAKCADLEEFEAIRVNLSRLDGISSASFWNEISSVEEEIASRSEPEPDPDDIRSDIERYNRWEASQGATESDDAVVEMFSSLIE